MVSKKKDKKKSNKKDKKKIDMNTMNKKGEVNLIGALIVVAIAIIIGAILLQDVARNVATTTNSIAVNYTVTPAAAGLSADLTGQEIFDTALIINRSGANIPCVSNFTVSEGVSPRTGTKRVLLTTASSDTSRCTQVNISYSAGMEGYIDDAAGRSVAPLIVIMMALAIGVIALSPTIRGTLSELVGKK